MIFCIIFLVGKHLLYFEKDAFHARGCKHGFDYKSTGQCTEDLLLSTYSILCRLPCRNNKLAHSSFAGFVEVLATKVSLDPPSVIPIQQDLEAMEVLGVLDPKHGYLDTMLGGYVALELQLLGKSYLNYWNACEIVAVLPD